MGAKKEKSQSAHDVPPHHHPDTKSLLTWVQVAGDALLRDTVEPLNVVGAVPDPQRLPSSQGAEHSEVDAAAVLERLQVPVALLR